MGNQIRKMLLELSEADFQKFQQRLLPGVQNILGIRLPKLRNMAKEIAKTEGKEFLRKSDSKYFEEIMLQGFVIGYLQEDIDTILKFVAEFVPKIDNWSVCDSFCTSLTITKEHPEKMWHLLQFYLKSEKEYELRFAVVMLLMYYLDEKNLSKVLGLLDAIESEYYYVKMAVAWALSIAYIKNEKITEKYLLGKNALDTFTYAKTIQKITESNQVGQEKKQYWKSQKKAIKTIEKTVII